MDKKAPQSPSHPWLVEKNHSPKARRPLPEGNEETTPDHDVFDLAASLKTSLRNDHIHRSNNAKKNR